MLPPCVSSVLPVKLASTGIDANRPGFVRCSSRRKRDQENITGDLADHEPVCCSVLATGIEERIVCPDLIDVTQVHALVLVQVNELGVDLKRVYLVQGFDVEPGTRHLAMVAAIV
jgi:hypothetical protein